MSAERPVAVVSGGSRGLGEALVRRLLDAGWTVATFSRSASPAIEELRRGDNFLWEALDATDRAGLQAWVLALARRFGRLDALVNNAAVAAEGVLPLMGEEEIHRMLAVNLEGAIHLARLCSRVMLQRGDGTILNVSSVAGLRGNAGLTVYGATKAALDGFTRGLARELGPRGIRVNSVAPGYLETEMTGAMTATTMFSTAAVARVPGSPNSRRHARSVLSARITTRSIVRIARCAASTRGSQERVACR